MVSAGLRPLAPYAGSIARWLCFCLQCNRTVEVTHHQVAAGGRCPHCAKISAAGIASGLAATGAIVGGGMVAGATIIAAAPVVAAAGAATGAFLLSRHMRHRRTRRLDSETNQLGG